MTQVREAIGLSSDDPLFAGDTVHVRDTITDESGDPMDLTIVQSITFKIADEFEGGPTRLSYDDSDSEMSIMGTDNDIVDIKLTQTDTSDLGPTEGKSIYEFRVRVVREGDGDTVTTGKICVRA